VIREAVSVGSLMADEQPTPPGGKHPGSETVRLASDLVEMARVVCFNRRTPGGRRVRVSEYLEALLREQITRDFEETQPPRSGDKKKGGRS
jgi:hypothetical protein